MNACGVERQPPRLPTRDQARSGRTCSRIAGSTEIVVQHDVGFAQRAHGLQRQQFRIAGAGADERDTSCSARRVMRRPRSARGIAAAARPSAQFGHARSAVRCRSAVRAATTASTAPAGPRTRGERGGDRVLADVVAMADDAAARAECRAAAVAVGISSARPQRARRPRPRRGSRAASFRAATSPDNAHGREAAGRRRGRGGRSPASRRRSGRRPAQSSPSASSMSARRRGVHRRRRRRAQQHARACAADQHDAREVETGGARAQRVAQRDQRRRRRPESRTRRAATAARPS